MTRTPFMAANWKMHLRAADVDAFCASVREALGSSTAAERGVRVGVFPPFVYLPRVVEALAGVDVTVGSQTARPEEKGAFTGEVAVEMVKDVGATCVIVGHSERRQIFGETDADVRARLDATLAAGLDVILCIGETIDERRADKTLEVVGRQLKAGLEGLDGETVATRVTVAYEPVWAIGTGLTATPEQAQEVHAEVRRMAAELMGAGDPAGADAAARLVIQYGGSVKPANVAELMACPDVDGALVGGASLEYSSFGSIVAFDRAGSETSGVDR